MLILIAVLIAVGLVAIPESRLILFCMLRFGFWCFTIAFGFWAALMLAVALSSIN